MTRYFSIAIGMALGWFGGQLGLFIHDRAVLKSPEQGFPPIGAMIDFLVINIASVILGGILGWVAYARFFKPTEEKNKSFRIPSVLSITVIVLTLILAIDALGLPRQIAFDSKRGRGQTS